MTMKTSDSKQQPKAQTGAEIKMPCEVYSRVVGYLRPVRNWHEGKQQEFAERKTFDVTPDA
jgi:ribonucleoside-triphosphate reductase